MLANNTVVHLADFGSPYPGNFIASLVALEKKLEEKNSRMVYVFPPRILQREWFNPFREKRQDNIYVLNGKVPYISETIEICKIIKREKPDLIHTHFSKYDLVGRLASAVIKPFNPISIIWHIHTPNESVINSNFLRKIKKFIRYKVLSNNVNILTVSEGARSILVNSGNWKKSQKINVILNAIDLKRLETVKTNSSEMRDMLGLPSDKFLFLFFGRIPKIKGLDIALDACEILANKNESFHFVIVGWEETEIYINEVYGNKKPKWLSVIGPRENVADLYNCVDCFCSFSREEGLPYSVCEAMGCGRSVVTSDIPGLEWAKGKEGVLFFKGFDVARAAECMHTVMSMDPQQRRQIELENQQFICEYFTVDRWCDDILDFYDSLLNS